MSLEMVRGVSSPAPRESTSTDKFIQSDPMFLHVEHPNPLKRNTAWCGATVTGPRVIGVDNMLAHVVQQPPAAPICEQCLTAILDRIGVAVRQTLGVPS